MELNWLEDFVAVARARNFSAAARLRHVTQPALSRRVRALEEWYGQTLFDRSSYPVSLTDPGTAFLPVAEQVVADLYRSRRAARARGQADGVARFAMPHSLAAGFFPLWWRGCAAAEKAIPSVVAADLDECVAMLMNGACQFLICYQHAAEASDLDGQAISSTVIGEDRFIPVHAPGLDWIAAPPGPGGQPVPLLGYHKHSFLGRLSEALVAKLEQQRPVRLVYQTALVDSLRTETLLGGGLAWLPERVVAEDIASGRLCRLANDDLAAPLTILLCQPEGAPVPFQKASGVPAVSPNPRRPRKRGPSP
ncbi:LysR family transcriptional regulator [Paracoccus suum]|uniref:LysR family transcriptional regulator n=1 Tax=Paracoccus suum TaxID=2259340 RepID=A0A344PGE8_9RHOB|nr:LysR family transcriptional regulator [Paracoccus suum]AXC48453.1 LysR family transcriptional regulator [Paracoccus suum]